MKGAGSCIHEAPCEKLIVSLIEKGSKVFVEGNEYSQKPESMTDPFIVWLGHFYWSG